MRKDFSPPQWVDMETLLLGWGEVQVKKKKKDKTGKCRSVCSLEEQSKHSKDAVLSLLYRLSLFKMEREDANPRAREATSRNDELSLDSTTSLQLP